METLRNKNAKNLKNNKEDFRFQVVDWKCYNETIEEDDEEESQYEDNSKYVIQMFGITENNESVSVKVNGFKPRFYVNIPNNWSDIKINVLIDAVKKKVKKRYKESIVQRKILHRKKFRGFTNNEKFKFLKLTFNNTYALNQYEKVFKKKLLIPGLSNKPKKYQLYESNIEPFLRFCHIKDIKTSGWVSLKKGKYKIVSNKLTTCQKELTVKWGDVEKGEKEHISPLIVMSFDIECDSSHGDFPLAKKNYKKLAQELLDNIHKKLKKEEKPEILENVEMQHDLLIKLINMSFKKEKNYEEISYCYTKDENKPTKKNIRIVAEKIASILFIKLERIANYKELREAVDHTKKIWSNQSIDILKKLAVEMGKKFEINPKKILNRIITRDIIVEKTNEVLDCYFPELEGDKVIQIGSTINRYGEEGCFLKHIITLNTCNPIDGVEVVQCKTEKEVLLEWAKFVRELDPDIVTGYNIFGFDFKFIYERAEELDCQFEMGTLGRMKNKELTLEEKNLSSSALGENILTYINMEGRVVMDLLKVVQKDHKLGSYKLDAVAENFISGSINKIEGNKLEVGAIKDLNQGNFITIFTKNDKYFDGKKFEIKELNGNQLVLNENIDMKLIEKKPSWRLAKDDIGPQDIFKLQQQDAEGRKIVAKYCIQDCALCNKLVNKLSIVSNNIGMANVCSVPLAYIFLRGQGVKIFSLVSKECRENDFLIPLLKKPKSDDDDSNNKKKKIRFNYGGGEDEDESEDDDEGGYEGAIVLPPKPGIYLDQCVTVLDYSSLYPSSMISENLSHDTYVMEDKYDNLPGYDYLDITHDVYEWIDPKIKSKGKKKVGQKTCRFVQFKDGSKGIIPMILQKLLKARKTTRKKIPYKTVIAKDGRTFDGLMDEDKDNGKVIIQNVEGKKMEFDKDEIELIKDTYNEFEKEVLDGLQLAYKVTANSLYGQIGARTSPIYLKDIAASTTATGRNLLYIAQEKTLEKFDGAEIVYGDTDSIFINFNPKDEKGKPLKNKEALKRSIELGVEAEEYIQQFLKKPHKLEYEKTFWPFVLFTKKRYLGDKYEFDLDKYKQTSMGIVLKRRDNAEIVKHVYGGIMNIIMKDKDINKSIRFLKEELTKLTNGEFPLDMLTITKSLKSYYKNPESICHKVLADRIGEREPGNKPLPNDRVPYIYIQTNGEVLLQGDRVENPDFIKRNNLKPDYLFYITNQIMKPVCQIYALIVENLEGYNYDKDYLNRLNRSYIDKHGEEKAKEKMTKKKNDLAGEILFKDIIREGTNKKNNIKPITAWFAPVRN